MSEHQRPPLHPSPAYTHPSARHHPYAPPAHRGSGSGSTNGHHAHHPLAAPHGGVSRRHSPPPPRGPPSPARSRGDEDSPPLSATKFDPADNYWEDVPPAPASLKMILDSFRRSGEGDRELLLSILGAKKSEEERLTAIIQTRLTLLQARLNLSAIQAQATLAMAPAAAAAAAAPGANGAPSPNGPPRPERTLSSTSQNSDVAQYYMQPQLRERDRGGPRERDMRERDPREMHRDMREFDLRERDIREERLLRERERDIQEMREREREREAREARDPRERDLRERERERIHLPVPAGYERGAERLPLDERRYSPQGRRGSDSAGERPEARERERDLREARDAREVRGREAQSQPAQRDRELSNERSRGLDMLIEGVREAEREGA